MKVYGSILAQSLTQLPEPRSLFVQEIDALFLFHFTVTKYKTDSFSFLIRFYRMGKISWCDLY